MTMKTGQIVYIDWDSSPYIPYTYLNVGVIKEVTPYGIEVWGFNTLNVRDVLLFRDADLDMAQDSTGEHMIYNGDIEGGLATWIKNHNNDTHQSIIQKQLEDKGDEEPNTDPV